MDAQTFQNKYRIDLGATYLICQPRSQPPLHYHFSDGYNCDVIKRHTPDRELRQMARTILSLNGADPQMEDEVLDDLRQLRDGLHNPYRVIATPQMIQ